jgi:hypothetical protein
VPLLVSKNVKHRVDFRGLIESRLEVGQVDHSIARRSAAAAKIAGSAS